MLRTRIPRMLGAVAVLNTEGTEDTEETIVFCAAREPLLFHC